MRKTLIGPLDGYGQIFTVLLPVQIAFCGAFAVYVLLVDATRDWQNLLPLWIGSLAVLAAGVYESYVVMGFYIDFYRNPARRWLSMFPVGREGGKYALRPSNMATDFVWILLWFCLSMSVFAWALTLNAQLYRYDEFPLMAGVVGSASLMVLFLALRWVFDRSKGSPRLVLADRPLFTGRPFSGELIVRGSGLAGRKMWLDLRCKRELKSLGSWGINTAVIPESDGSGNCAYRFTFDPPRDLAGVLSFGVVWSLTARLDDGGNAPDVYCRFSHLPVFPAPPDGESVP